jgi:hypothetical protein
MAFVNTPSFDVAVVGGWTEPIMRTCSWGSV